MTVLENLLLTGGPVHDFDASTAVVVELLEAEGISSVVVEDPDAWVDALAEDPQRWDLATVNALRWQMGAPRHAHLRDRWAFALDEAQAAALDRYVRDGGGLLACHAAIICFDGNARWTDLLGGAWNWDRSSHPPFGPARITPTAAADDHPLTERIEPFTIDDEIYGWLDQRPDVEPLLTSPHGGTDHPVLWARQVGSGRVVTDLLGHDAAAMAHPAHAEILRRAARWLVSPSTDRSRPHRSPTP